jgi:heme exporter protein A
LSLGGTPIGPGAFGGLKASSLALIRGERTLFTDLSFDLASGELLRLLGPNGSGKSSLLRALLGLTPLARGQLLAGPAGRRLTPREVCAQTLYQGHAHGTKGELTAIENLALAAELDDSLAGSEVTRVLDAALDEVGLVRQRHIETRRLSQGQKQRLNLARFAIGLQVANRPLWLMDEPSAALDASGLAVLEGLLGRHLARGGAAIVATHLPIAPTQGKARELHLEPFTPRRVREGLAERAP